MERSFRLVVLGVAQDGGLPHVGCSCERCSAARSGARPRQKVACLGLTDGTRGWLFDATPDLPEQVHALGAGTPEGVFLTHAHMGHYTGLVHLGREALDARGVALHATPCMAQFLRANAPWSALVANGNVVLRDNADVDVGGVRVRAIPVPHRQEFSDTVAYRIDGPRRRALFVPDIDRWEQWDRDVLEEVADVDVAYLDATFATPAELGHRDVSRVPHPFVEDTVRRLATVAARVRFIHLNHTNPLWHDATPVEAHGFRVAQEGESVEL